MNSCKTFAKTRPMLLVVLTFVFLWVLLKLRGLIPDGPLRFGISEFIMAVIIFITAILFMGKEKVSFSAKGFGYAFRTLRGYYIFLTFVTVFTTAATILEIVVLKTDSTYQPSALFNILLGCFSVGIVEEFTFRGLMFGGLLQKLGNTKRSIIIAACISGMIFGVAHVLDPILSGEITSMGAAITAVLKTFQCAIFGIILCFIYYKTRNLFVAAILHGLDDFMLMFFTSIRTQTSESYVGTDNLGTRVGAYVLFIMILVPSLVRCIRNLKPGEAIPFDEDFMPRDVEFEEKKKN